MSFTWPLALLTLLVVPLLVGAYLLQARRKKKLAVSYSSVALIRVAMPRRSRWRRLLPMVLFLVGLGGLGVASARPQASLKVPLSRTSIILAMDVSRSMCATDVDPNRLTVAQAAARGFVENQPSGTRIGIVAFADFAELVVPPTTDKDKLTEAIDNFTTARGTAIGSATLKALDAIAGINPDVAPIGADVVSDTDPSFGTEPTPDVASPDAVSPAPGTPATPPAGGYEPDIVVLLTDGANTRGVDPIEAAQQAVDRRVRVYTIGFGTLNPTEMVCTPQQLGAGAFGDGGFGGGGFPPGGFAGGGRRRFLVIDEETLQAVADTTGGSYYRAEDADQLNKVFTNLPKDVTLQKRDVELSAGFAGAGALLVASAVVLSLLWNRSP